MKHMRRIGATSVVPAIDAADRARLPKLPALYNSSGYIVRARDRLPKSTGRYPWVNGQNWFYDAWYNLVGSLTRGLVYTVPGQTKKDD